MPVRTADELREFITSILLAAGAPESHATIVAHSVVDSNLAGHDSHGVVRIPHVVKDVASGKLKPSASPRVTHERSSTATVDGGSTFGHVGCRLATDLAIRKARETAIAAIALTRANHTGRIGEWAEIGADAGMVTIVLGSRANSSRGTPGGTLAPFGGKTGALGTSPIAWSVPRRGGLPPILLDFATSVVAQGKLQIARAKGERVPFGWIIDSDGRPTTDVEAFFRGGAQLPFGGHKGYALSLMVSLMAIGLSAGDGLDPAEHGSCLFVVCVDPAAFRPAEDFLDYVEATAARIKAVPPAEGFDEVLLPGEPEARSRAARLRDGIPVPDEIWADLLKSARSVGLNAERESGTGPRNP
jgi:LDH2 family malate/lactate/ureidoglycolate dehydrogenase